jgi:glycosyltransferase involved in cell wall biosynthesis
MSIERGRHVVLVVENLPLARDHRLRKQAEALVGGGYRVTVICRADPENHSLPGVRVREYPAPRDGSSPLGFAREYGYSLAAAAARAARTFAGERFDAIQVSGTPDVYFTVAAPFRRLGARFVFDQRDLSPELYELRYGRQDAVYRTLLRLERRSYRSADHVVTVNPSLERIAYERGGLPPGRVTVVGNGPRLGQIARAEPRPELRRGRRHLALWVGVMGPQDRVELALRAVARVVHGAGRTDTHFAFAGDGESRAPAQRLATELGLDDYVSFPGWLAEPDVHAYLATADLGLEPNLEEIVSPVKAMEYMALGVPFVAFDLTETRRLAGDAAVCVPAGDVEAFAAAVDGVLADPARRAAMGRAGRTRVAEELSWERQEIAYLDVYRRLLDPAAEDRSRPRDPVEAGR